MLYGPTNEELVTRFSGPASSPKGAAAQPLPHPVEVPGRDQAALRGDAWTRVPDEGFLFLRSHGRGCPRLLQQDVRLLSAHVQPHGAEVDSHARPKLARSAATSATNSSSWPTPARARSFATGISSSSIRPAPTSTMRGICRRSISPWTSKYAATSEKHDVDRFDKEVPDADRSTARGIEVGQIFYLRHQVLRTHGMQGPGA